MRILRRTIDRKQERWWSLYQLIGNLAVVPVICGCATRVDESKLIAAAGRANAQSIELRKIFPDTKVDIKRTDANRKGEGFLRFHTVSWTARLDHGFEVVLTQVFKAAPDGASIKELRNSTITLRNSSGEADLLTEQEFDALLAKKGDLASLQPFGFDIGLRPVDAAKATKALRKIDPHVGRLYETYPGTAWTEISKRQRFKSEANALVGAHIGQGYSVTLSRAIRIAADGVTPELVGQTSFSLTKQNAFLGTLTEEQFEAILDDPSLKVLGAMPLQDLRKSGSERRIDRDPAGRREVPPDS